MKNLRNERGIALITALMLSFLAMVIILALLYIISQGTKVSAANKRYKSALEASYGGVELFAKEIVPQWIGTTGSASLAALLQPNLLMGGHPSTFNSGDSACIQDKLLLIPSQWSHCSTGAITLDPKNTSDAQFTLKGQPGQPNFNIYAKIVDTQPGNSDTSGLSELLDSASGVAYGAAGVSPKHMPAIYRIEVQGERETNPLERAKLSVLYVY